MFIWLSYIVELVVEPAGVADGLAVGVSPPEGRLGRLAVGARGAFASGRTLLSMRKKKTKKQFSHCVKRTFINKYMI
jgi:hypothetical protein